MITDYCVESTGADGTGSRNDPNHVEESEVALPLS